MKSLPLTFKAYAELARVSNVPTCISNSLVGCAIAAGGGLFPWSSVPPVAGAVCLFYVAGMILNDVFDRRIDALERPERPIPSGRVGVVEAWGLSAAAIFLGLGLLVRMSLPALYFGLLLIGLILLYDWLHKRHPASVLLMGACRSTVYFVSGAAISWPLNTYLTAWLASTLGLYTVSITIVARSENRGVLDRRRWLAVALPPLILVSWWVVGHENYGAAAVSGFVLMFWLARAAGTVFASPPDTRAAIHLWISGMCLIDIFFLTLLGQPLAALGGLLCFGLTVYSHRHIAGT